MSNKIGVNVVDGVTRLKVILGNKITWHETGGDDITAWLLYHCRYVFDAMPCAIEFHCNPKAKELHGSELDNLCIVLGCTNECIKKHQVHFRRQIRSSKTLTWNVAEDIRYKSFFDTFPADTVHFNLELGFNRLTREWDQTRDSVKPVDELIEWLITENIGAVVTVNHYVSERYMGEAGIFLPAILNWLGIKYYPICHDPHDLNPSGFYRKGLHAHFASRYFSGMGILNKHWDDKWDIPKVQYVPIPQDYHAEQDKRVLDPDYSIVVLSNSRWGNVQAVLPQIKGICGAFPKDRLLTDIQLWYMAARHLILNVLEIPEHKRLKANSELHQFFFALLQWIKYEIICKLQTSHKVDVYGDIGWQHVCPQYYRGSLDNAGIERLYAEGDHLYLLMNFSFSYMDASGPVYDVIRRGVPFINVPPIAKTISIGDMSLLEYGNYNRLNELANNPFSGPELDQALKNVRAYYQDGMDAARVSMGIAPKGSGYPIEFERQLACSEALIQELTIEFLDAQEPFVRDTVKGLFRV